MKKFNQKAAYLPNLGGTAVKVDNEDEKSMVEREQPVPVLTPDGMFDVKKRAFTARLHRERTRLARLHAKAQRLYRQPLSVLQMPAATQQGAVHNQGHCTGFNAQARSPNRKLLSAFNANLEETISMTTETEKESLTDEQKRYVATLGNKKRLYRAQRDLLNGVTIALSNAHDPKMMKLAKSLGAASESIQTAASYLHQEQKAMEQVNPELKTQAIAYSKTREQTQSEQHTM